MTTNLHGVYVTKEELKAYMADQQNANFNTRDDKIISRFCVMASRRLESWCKRSFLPRWDTNYYDQQSQHQTSGVPVGAFSNSLIGGLQQGTLYSTRLVRRRSGRSQELMLSDDLLGLGVVKTQNGAVTIPNTDLLLRRGPSRNVIPYDIVEISLSSTYGWSAGSSFQNAHSVTGYWGFHSHWPTGAWETIGTHKGVANTSATTLTINGSPDVEVGQYFGPAFQEQMLIKFGTTVNGTEELAYITRITDNDGVTFTIDVIRGVNGTTPISLTNGMTIQAYRPMYEVQEAIYELATYQYRRRYSVGKRDDRTIVASASGMVMLPSTIPDTIKDFVNRYKRRMPRG